jgi:hypothetical protein
MLHLKHISYIAGHKPPAFSNYRWAFMQRKLIDNFLNWAMIIVVPLFIIKALPIIGFFILNEVILWCCGTILCFIKEASGFATYIIFY